MALKSAGTTSTTGLRGIVFAPAQGVGAASAASLLPPADMAAIAAGIADDKAFSTTAPWGILATGTTHATTTLDTLAAVAGGALATIQVGALVVGVGAAITPGTFVIAKPTATSVLLSQAAGNSAAGVKLGFINPAQLRGERLSFMGRLEIPNRGVINVLPGDLVAIDNTGWPILVSAASVGYTGSLWNVA